MQFAARDKGDGTTDLYFSFVNNTIADTPVFNLTVNDSTGGLQTTGRQGVGVYNPDGITIIGTHTTVYSLYLTGGGNVLINGGLIGGGSLMGGRLVRC